MINPEEIPQIPGKLDVLASHAASLKGSGQGFTDTGTRVHSTFQGLAPHYVAPEAGQLFAATQPVSTLSADIGDDLGTIAGALDTYAQTVKPIQQRLQALRSQAALFVQEVSGDNDWREDDSRVEQHNSMLTAVNDALAEWMEAQRVCANTILALYTDRRYHADDGDGVVEDGEYGYTAEQLNQALGAEQGLPWGTPEQEDEGFLGGLWSGVKGFVVDGVWSDLTGLGSLLGISGDGWSWQTMQDAWGGLANLTVLPYLDDVWRGDLTPWQATTTVWGNWGQVGQGMLAWDEWGHNPARAFGQVLWNVVTIPIAATKALKPVTAAGHAADAGRVAGAAGDAGRLSRITSSLADTVRNMPTAGDVARNVAHRLNIQLPRFGPVPAFAGDISTGGHRFDVETPSPLGPDTAHMNADTGRGTDTGPGMDTGPGPDGSNSGSPEPPRTPDSSPTDTTPSTSDSSSPAHPAPADQLAGPRVELSPTERTALEEHLAGIEQRYPDQFDRLQRDPDKSGGISLSSKDEGRVALDLREQGRLPADIDRPPARGMGDYFSPSTGTYYDLKGVHSDWPSLSNQRDRSIPFPGAYNPSNNTNFINTLDDQIAHGRIVVLDVRNANQAAIDDLQKVIEDRGWTDVVIWYP